MAQESNRKIDLASLQIQPNPIKVGQQLKIGYYNAPCDHLTLEVRDVDGNIVLNEDLGTAEIGLKEMDSSMLGAGQYYFIFHGDIVHAVRFVVIND